MVIGDLYNVDPYYDLNGNIKNIHNYTQKEDYLSCCEIILCWICNNYFNLACCKRLLIIGAPYSSG